MPRFVITGAPGSGKTTLLRALGQHGFEIVEEAATDVIAREQGRGVDAPWQSPRFIDDIVALQRERQLAATGEVQLFDRSPVCALALCRWLGFAPTAALQAELERVRRERIYEPRVFFLQNLGFIEPTAARRISFEDTLKFEALHEQVYLELGYQLVPVPPAPLDERAAILSAAIGAPTPSSG